MTPEIMHITPQELSARRNFIDTFFENAVFISGMGRSGTTLLLRLIDSHPEVYLVPQESTIFTHLLPAFKRSHDVDAFIAGLSTRFAKMVNREICEIATTELSGRLRQRCEGDQLSERAIFRDLLDCLALAHSPIGRKLWI